jgi:hypothetical protein
MNENEMNKSKALYFKDKDISVHITKKNGRWNNGKIESIEEDKLIIDDREDGDTPIFLMEILDIEKFTEDRR